jgi:uncharacterized repeat protein (TIGR01451 family)
MFIPGRVVVKRSMGWSFAATLLGILLWPSVLVAQREDDWPIRLRIAEAPGGGRTQWIITAENLADFPCTKLRLQAAVVGGTLLRGGGQSAARLVDGRLLFDEIASIPPGETYRWTVDLEPLSGGTTRIQAELEYAEKHAPKPAPRKNCKDYRPPAESGMTAAELALPTGSRATSALVVHQVMPVEVDRNKPYIYKYYVTNISDAELQNVELTASSFRNLVVAKSDPAAEKPGGDTLTWMLGDLAECETRVITVTASSPEVGTASACLAATYANRLCAMTRVVEPGLEIVKAAPAEALICDEVEMVLTVTNPGTGVARNVKVRDALAEGLTAAGKASAEGEAGDLSPGESKRMAFKVKASKTGKYTNQATVEAAGGLSAKSNSTVTVFRQPILQIACSAPEQRFIDRSATFNLEVKNVGDAPSASTVVKASVTGGEVSNLTKGGTASRGEVTWSLGALPPGASQTLSFDAKTTQAGMIQASASASGVCAASVRAACETRVIGIPAILLEVVDIEDPVEVGKTTTYVITVTNQGTAPGTNIKVACDIPELSAYVSSTGASPASAAGNRVTLGTIPSLPPKQKVEWRLIVTAKAEGDARLRVEMSSDQFAEPVRETESTNHYK